MITQLTTVKARLNILATDTQFDPLLTNAIQAVGAGFEQRTRRALARTAGATHEFPANETEICVACYPIESVSAFDLKSNDLEGWVTLNPPAYLVRGQCVISLGNPLGTAHQQARVTYTGGYVLPGSIPAPGQFALPPDLEQAAVEQVAAWFQNRDKLGLVRNWPSGGVYQQFIQLPLLPAVAATLRDYERWNA